MIDPIIYNNTYTMVASIVMDTLYLWREKIQKWSYYDRE